MTQAETYISTPNSSNDYTYTYDALGNVQVVYRASGSTGQEAYFFAQDAFGNELSGDANIPVSNRTNLLGGATWATARTAGITEHQAGKIASTFTGLQYFYARWYDPTMGRFVGRDPEINENGGYISVLNAPTRFIDPTGAVCTEPKVYVKHLNFLESSNTWGHEWVVWPGNSAGIYEDVPGGGDSCVGFGGAHVVVPDPKGNTGCHKYWDTKVVPRTTIDDVLGITSLSRRLPDGTPCCSATCSQIYKCLNTVAKQYDPGMYIFPIKTCWSLAQPLLSKCCLEVNKKHTGSLKGGTEP